MRWPGEDAVSGEGNEPGTRKPLRARIASRPGSERVRGQNCGSILITLAGVVSVELPDGMLLYRTLQKYRRADTMGSLAVAGMR